MSRWFRFYDDAVNDPKVQRLPGEKFKAWVNLLCLASRNEGALPCLADIAFSLRLDEDAVSTLLDEFCSLGLMDPVEVENAPMSYEPHNWAGRQYKSDQSDGTAAQRSKRYRDGKRDASRVTDRDGAVSVTATRADTEQKQRTEQNVTRLPAPDGWPSNFREVFWEAYPHKVGKSDALAKLEKVRRSGIAFESIVVGLAAYLKSKPPDRPWCNPATWLHQGRWEDQPDNGQQQRRIPDV